MKAKLMTWEPTAAEGGSGPVLFKKPGGFFVGTRPECEIALGVVGMYAIHHNAYDNTPSSNTENHRRVVFGPSAYFLVVHPETINPGTGPNNPRVNGWRLRTMSLISVMHKCPIS